MGRIAYLSQVEASRPEHGPTVGWQVPKTEGSGDRLSFPGPNSPAGLLDTSLWDPQPYPYPHPRGVGNRTSCIVFRAPSKMKTQGTLLKTC